MKPEGKPCPRCGVKGNRSVTDNGTTWLFKCLRFGCRAQWVEKKGD